MKTIMHHTVMPAVALPSLATMLFGAREPSDLETGTGYGFTFPYLEALKQRNCKYTTLFSSCAQGVATARAKAGPADDLAYIRSVLKPTIRDLADLLGVSRQAVYDWQSGKSVAHANVLRLSELARAADLFAQEGMADPSQVFRRAIRDGKSFVDLVMQGDSPVSAAQALIRIMRSESVQRRELERRLAGRKKPTREAIEEISAPMLDEM